MRSTFLAIFFFLIVNSSFGQIIGFKPKQKNNFDFSLTKKKDTKTAVILSSILPGSGQFYNGKLYKIPIIYTLGSFTVYEYLQINSQYHMYYNDELLLQDTNFTDTSLLKSGITDINTLAQKISETDRKRQYFAVGTFLVWTLNVIDAYIDAEFSDFDVSEDLTLSIRPTYKIIAQKPFYGLSLNLYF